MSFGEANGGNGGLLTRRQPRLLTRRRRGSSLGSATVVLAVQEGAPEEAQEVQEEHYRPENRYCGR